MEELASERKSDMLAGAQQCYSNVEKGEFVANTTISLEDSAVNYQSLLLNALTDGILDAYKRERRFFAEWYNYQQVISEEVIGDLWELFVGGSAGGTFQTIYLYDIANANAAEQATLYESLVNNSLAGLCEDKSSFQELDSAINELKTKIQEQYDMFNNANQDYSVYNTSSQLKSFLDKDLELFKNWIAKRDDLEHLMEEGGRESYASNTAYWRYLYLQKYQF